MMARTPEVDDTRAAFELGYCAALLPAADVGAQGGEAVPRILAGLAARYREAGRALEAGAFARACEAWEAGRLEWDRLEILRRLLALPGRRARRGTACPVVPAPAPAPAPASRDDCA